MKRIATVSLIILLLLTGCGKNLAESDARKIIEAHFAGKADVSTHQTSDACDKDLIAAGAIILNGWNRVPSKAFEPYFAGVNGMGGAILRSRRVQITSVRIKQVEGSPQARIVFDYSFQPSGPALPISCVSEADDSGGDPTSFGVATATKFTDGWKIESVNRCRFGGRECFSNFDLQNFSPPTATPMTRAQVSAIPGTSKDEQEGVSAYERGDYANALRILRTASSGSGGNVRAYYIGMMNYTGKGVARDLVRARMWFQVAAYSYAPAVEKFRLVESEMTKQQIEESQNLFESCAKNNFELCS